MRRLLSLLLLFAPAAFPYASYSGWCEQGGVRPTTAGQVSTQYVQQSYPNFTASGSGPEVTVYLTGTQNKATLYSDNSGTSLGNPMTCSKTGQYSFFVATGSYDLTFSGSGISSFTLAAIQIIDAPAISDAINVTAGPCLAKGDGSTDDTAAVNTCLALAASTGRPLYFPAATYLICGSSYSGASPQTVFGDGMILTSIKPYGGFASCSNMLTISTTGNVTIHDLGTDMGFTGHSLTSGSNITIQGTGSAGALSPVASVNLYNLYTANSKSVGIQCTACNNIDYHDSYSHGNYFFGFSASSSGTTASPLWVSGFHVHGVTFDQDNIGAAVNFFMQDGDFTGNTLRGSALGIYQDPHAVATFNDNVFDGSPTQGCFYDSQCGTVAGNWSPISLEGVSDWSIGVNHFKNINGAQGVVEAFGSNLQIPGSTGTITELPTSRGRIDGVTIDDSDAGFPILITGRSNGPNPTQGADIKVQNTKLSNTHTCGNFAGIAGFDLSNNSCNQAAYGGWNISSVQHGSVRNNFCHNCNTVGGSTASLGTVTATQGSANITGSGTTFTSSMVNGRFTVQGSTYQVCTYSSATAIVLCNPVVGAGGSGLTYSLYYGGGLSYAAIILGDANVLDLQIDGNATKNDNGSATSVAIQDGTGVSPSVSMIRYDTTNTCTGYCDNGLYSPLPSFIPTLTSCGTSPSNATYATNFSGFLQIGTGTITACTVNFAGQGFVGIPSCSFVTEGSAVPLYITTTTASLVTFNSGATDMHGVYVRYSCTGTLADATWYPVSQ